MARRATQAGIGVTLAVLVLVNGALIVARSGSDGSRTVEAGSAKSASVAVDQLGEDRSADETPVPTTPPATVPTGGGDRPTPTTPPTPTPAPTTVPSRPPASTTTTAKAPPAGGVDGPGLYVVAPDGTGVRKLGPGYGMFSWSPDGTRLAYASGAELIVVRADGTGQTTLPAGRGALAPQWSPDGARIAFSRDGGTYVVRSDGSGTATVVDANAHLSGWTRDGRVVVITSVTNGWSQVVLHDLAGGRAVLASDAGTLVQPEGSPDGRLVAYMSNRILVAGVERFRVPAADRALLWERVGRLTAGVVARQPLGRLHPQRRRPGRGGGRHR